MKIENRMDEFEKVAETQAVEDVKERMQDFKQVDKKVVTSKDKEGTLPYGLKRYKTCPYCDEMMEIHEIKDKKAVYRCKSCGKQTIFELNK